VKETMESLSLLQSEQGAMWIAGLAGLSVFIVTLAMLMVLSRRYDPVRRRVLGLADRPRRSPLQQLESRLVLVGQYFEPTRPAERAKLVDRLVQAGYRSPQALPLFVVLRMLSMGVAALVATGVVELWIGKTLEDFLLYGIAAVAVGYVAPSFLLDRKVRDRQQSLRNAVPDLLDLLVVCTEAGLSLDASLQRVAREMEIGYPEMAFELKLVNAEIHAGIDRFTALGNLATRTGVEEMMGFVASLGQSVRFGTSIGESLRVYAEEFRDKRRQRAEEEAAKLTVKLLFPLGLCLLPAFIIVTVGAAFFSLAESFSGM
jgi:tight adherence protein C